MKIVINGFIQYWKDKKSTPAGRMATAYENSAEEAKRIQVEMLALIRPEKTSKGLIAIFAPEAEGLMDAFVKAQKDASDVSADIEKYLALTNGDPSTERLLSEKLRLQNGLNNVQHAAKNSIARAIKGGKAKSAIEAESQPEVQDALLKRERIESEFTPQLKEVEASFKKIATILKKY